MQRKFSLAATVFMKLPAVADFKAFIAHKSKLHKRQTEGTVTSYCKAINYLLEMCVTDDVIFETDGDMMQFIQSSIKSPTK